MNVRFFPVSSTTQCSPSNSFYNNNNLRFSSSSGTIRSPQYPLNYPSSMQCTWIITVPYGKKAELSFTSVSTEGGICSSNDYVQVRDGSSSDRSLGLFCSKPSTIRASGRTLWVRFRSDSDVFTGRGFEGRYTTQKSKCPRIPSLTGSTKRDKGGKESPGLNWACHLCLAWSFMHPIRPNVDGSGFSDNKVFERNVGATYILSILYIIYFILCL